MRSIVAALGLPLLLLLAGFLIAGLSGSAGSKSKELVAPAAAAAAAAGDTRAPSFPPALLSYFQGRRGPAARSLLSSGDLDKQDRFVLVFEDGAVLFVDRTTGERHWIASPGSALCSSKQFSPDADHYYFARCDGSLVEHNKGSPDRILNWTIEDYLLKTPDITGSRIIIGSVETTIQSFDSRSGNEISKVQLPAAQELGNGEKTLLPKLETGRDYIVLIRTKYTLNCTDLDRLLWYTTVSRLQAIYVKGSLSSEVGHQFIVPSPFRKAIPVYISLRPREEMLALSNGVGMPLKYLEGPSEAANKCSSGKCVDGESNADGMSLQLVSISSHGAKEESAEILHRSFGIILMWFMIPSLLIVPALYYLKLRSPEKSEKQLDGLRERQAIVTKKRKARKTGNKKNLHNHESHASVDRDNYEANGHINNELRSFRNLIPSGNVGDGRWIGKLFVSNSEIGRGSNGTVVLEGVYEGRPVAVKRLLRAHNDVALKEIRNLISSDWHPNIVRLYGVEQDIDFVYISLERCTCSLNDLIQVCSSASLYQTETPSSTFGNGDKNGYKKVLLEHGKDFGKDLELWKENGFPSPQLLKLMRDVVSGLAHLHELGIIHRDIKPHNVLISNDRSLNAKLSDMGISKRLVEDMSSLSHHATGYGSSGWQAPEQLLHERQTRSVDLFSLGCFLFFCITKGKHPFGNTYERDSNIINNRMDLFLVDHIPEAVHLLRQLLDPSPKMRPSAIAVLYHPFFWSSELRLSFLRDTSDRVELEDRENESELLKALENVATLAFGGKWGEKLDSAFLTDMGRYRKYNFDSTRDLLRVIRNRLNHYRALPNDLQEILGGVPDGFDRYFTTRFPNLLIEVYEVICTHCREEDCFTKYFTTTVVGDLSARSDLIYARLLQNLPLAAH